MRSLLSIASVVVVTALAGQGVARADGVYFSEAFGGGAVRDQLSQHVDAGSFRVKVAVGYRASKWAVEGWLAPEFGFQQQVYYDCIDYCAGDTAGPTMISYGLDAKRIMPVNKHVSVYVRGSMSRMTLSDNGLDGYSGRGLGAGVGGQVSGKVNALGFLAWPLFFLKEGPKVNAAVFLDEGYDFYRLHRAGSDSIDAQVTRWTFGFAIGSDF